MLDSLFELELAPVHTRLLRDVQFVDCNIFHTEFGTDLDCLDQLVL